jgi:predicted short-subunit dehydrogenase-like oxidoreductase (DUF2520 family)
MLSIYVKLKLLRRPEKPCYAASMPPRPTFAIVGAGRVGTALARELFGAGFTAREIISPAKRSSQNYARRLAASVHARSATIAGAQFDADLIWICVPDRNIALVARRMASRGPSARLQPSRKKWQGKIVVHSSGSLTSDELDLLRQCGSAVASVHPLMTFVPDSLPSLRGVPFGIEGDPVALRAARKLLQRLGARIFRVAKENKAVYHAWGTLLSPLFLSFLVATENVACQAGLSARDARTNMLPILQQTLENYVALGPAEAFSGPIARGDLETVSRHLQALRTIPRARDVYVALARSAVRHLPVRNRLKLTRLFEEMAAVTDRKIERIPVA